MNILRGDNLSSGDCMKISVRACLFVIMLSAFWSCGSKGPSAGSPEEVLLLLKKHGGTDEVRGLYSADTIKQMEKYMDSSGMDLKFLKEGPEKSRGLLVKLTMVKENGNWRIDRSDDFKELLKSQKNRETENYLNRIR